MALSRSADRKPMVRWSVRMRLAATAIGTGVLLGCAAVASAQVNTDTPESAKLLREAELAREFTDPLTTLPQLFFQDVYTPAYYGTEAPANRVIARVIVPRVPRISLFPDQLIRPTFQLVTVPTGKGSGDTRTEFGDMQLFDFGVIPWPSRQAGLLMGAGPV